ncbi:hypothetical protein BJV85_003016 [Clostridium acetobutylicum]|nr:hypothetical protein [Clostridium acetobutylicum]NOW15668.1 hypothetical protein [Clostridium acetobutylicum]NRY57347.1 hypothetical protein [Clostridium acetobutylicum]NSA94093.1 hypothetical protein [Clostridium acetobutylicum]NYC95233.1 hypothetical protein [Clostridium acetobutylicum]
MSNFYVEISSVQSCKNYIIIIGYDFVNNKTK